MKLFLARHGQSTYNVLTLHNYDPSIDVHLTALGKTQAETLAEKLKNESIDHMFTSQLKRTKQTAAIINKYHGASISEDPRLNDNNSGFEGRPDKEYDLAISSVSDPWTARLNGGESLEDVQVRIQDFIDSLKSESYENCLIVTSRIIIQMICIIIKNLPNETMTDFYVETGGLIEIEAELV